jgi:hypothetical protein
MGKSNVTFQRAPAAERYPEAEIGWRVLLDGQHIGQVARSTRFRGTWQYSPVGAAYVKATRAAGAKEIVDLYLAQQKRVAAMCPTCGGTGQRP